MKISELIESLQAFQLAYGDVEVKRDMESDLKLGFCEIKERHGQEWLPAGGFVNVGGEPR